MAKILQGIDGESSPSVKALSGSGKEFVCRYLSTPGNPKNITPAEVRILKGGKIGIVVVFENAGNRALGGWNAGFSDALSASKQARAAGLGNIPIYFAVDFEANSSQIKQVLQYVRGAVKAIGWGRTGVYGGEGTIAACKAAKVCRWFWQTYAWSGTPTRWIKGCHVQQYDNSARKIGGVSVDLDRALRSDYGQKIWPLQVHKIVKRKALGWVAFWASLFWRAKLR